MNGVSPLARSLDSFGWMTRSVTDAAIVFAALTGMELDLDAAPPKIGVCRTPVWDKADPDMQALLERTARQLAGAGAEVADVALPSLFDDLVDAQKTVMAFETAESMAGLRRRSEGLLSRELRALIDDGASIDRRVYRNALALAERGRGEFRSLEFDALLVPSARGEAPVGLEATGDPIFSRLWTLLGMPCLSLPVGVGINGLPLGLQLIGSMHGEERLFATARWVEQTAA